MEKTEITALDLRFLVRELKEEIIGGLIRKIYQYDSKEKQFLFEFFVPGKGGIWLYSDKDKVFITKRKKAVPQEPPNFCMFLRKHLMGKRVSVVRQRDFDRILEIGIGDNILIFELLRPGNVILCDSSMNILSTLEIQKWRDREIRPKRPYKYPPRVENPFELDFDSFVKMLKRSEKKLIAFLAATLGLGALYAQEVCKRAGTECEKLGEDYKIEDLVRVHETIMGLDKGKGGFVYSECVTPFRLKDMGETRKFGSFSEALDEFFSGQEIEIVRKKEEGLIKEEKERVERIISKQEEAGEKWKSIGKESREKAEAIYNYYTIVEAALNGIRKARDSGMSWGEIKERVKTEGTPEAEAIKEIREGDGIVVLDLGGMEVEIDIRKSVEENAAMYYEDVKWARKKIGGTEQAREEQEKKLEEVSEIKPTVEVFEREKPAGGFGAEERPKRARKKWYEKFRWFFSSDGFLVIGGKSAVQNEMIMKKHLDKGDLVFHADIQGASLVVVKAQGMEVPDETKREAAEFSAANSKAWSRGLGNVDVYYVRDDQVSKSPPSGEALPKGSFMIYGERGWYRDMEIKLSIGVKLDREKNEGRVISGPVMAVRKNSDYFVTIKPGIKKSMELAKAIRNKILIKSRPEDKFLIEKIPLEDLQNMVPSGMGDVVDIGA